MRYLILVCCILSVTNGAIFGNNSEPSMSIQRILEDFNENALEKYKSAMPQITDDDANEVNGLLDEIYSQTENKRMVNQTKIRFNTFLTESKNAIKNSLTFIENGLSDVKKQSMQTTNQIFNSAKTLEADLIKKNCSDQEVVDLLSPYINQTVECIRTAAQMEVNYERNANIASKSMVNIIDSVKLSLQLCTNKGIRSAMCAQRVTFFLSFFLSFITFNLIYS